MRNSIKGTVAAMVVSMGVFGSAMTVCAAPADEVSLHTTQMTFEITEDEEPHEITDAQRQQLHENLARGAQENTHELTDEEIHEKSMEHAKKEADSVIKFFEDIINFFS